MTTINVATARTDGFPMGSAVGAVGACGGISQEAIDRGVNRGRRLRAQAMAHAFKTLGRWVVDTARAAAGRRATTRLGCGECGDMMRA